MQRGMTAIFRILTSTGHRSTWCSCFCATRTLPGLGRARLTHGQNSTYYSCLPLIGTLYFPCPQPRPEARRSRRLVWQPQSARQDGFADHPTRLVTPAHSLVAIPRNRWSRSVGTSGRNRSVRVVAISRNEWSQSVGARNARHVNVREDQCRRRFGRAGYTCQRARR
jgi:hypothetical protein